MWDAGECIGILVFLSLPIVDLELILLQLTDPSGYASLGCRLVDEPFEGGMVGNNVEFVTMDIDSKLFDGPNNCKTFEFGGMVILFCCSKTSTGVDDNSLSLFIVFLR